PAHRETGLKIPDPVFLVHAWAVVESVAVEEDVARDEPPFRAGKQVPAKIRGGNEIARTGQAGVDARRAVVIRQVPAKAQLEAGIGIRLDVTERATQLR